MLDQGLASFLAAAARVATNPITDQVSPPPLLPSSTYSAPKCPQQVCALSLIVKQINFTKINECLFVYKYNQVHARTHTQTQTYTLTMAMSKINKKLLRGRERGRDGQREASKMRIP